MDGAIYVSRGVDYYDLAIQSVATLRQHNPNLRVDLFTDQPDSSGLFDSVRSIPEGPSPKLAALSESRFRRTLYLDCDTLVVAPFGDLFQLLDRFDLAVAHDVRRTSSLIREEWLHEMPYAFPQMNAGVLLYSDRPAMRDFLLRWQAEYALAGRQRDQITFRDLLWSSDLAFYVLPPEFNLRRTTMLDAWEPLDARPTIIHSHRLLQHLRGEPSRIRSVEDVIAAERIALSSEWSAFEAQDADGHCACPVSKFHFAERVAESAPDPAVKTVGSPDAVLTAAE
jgi:hypothetical protein